MTYNIVAKIGDNVHNIWSMDPEDVPNENAVIIDSVVHPDVEWFLNKELISEFDQQPEDVDFNALALSVQSISDQVLCYVDTLNGLREHYYSVRFHTHEGTDFWMKFAWLECNDEIVSPAQVYTFSITKKEFAEKYRDFLNNHSDAAPWFCNFIYTELVKQHNFVADSFEVCSEFYKAAPQCFDEEPSHFISYVTTHMKNEYVDGVPEPRLVLLEQIPDGHVFTFNMYFS